jgi:hypothetical protein
MDGQSDADVMVATAVLDAVVLWNRTREIVPIDYMVNQNLRISIVTSFF